MNIVDRSDLPMRCPVVAKSCDCIALQIRLRAGILLPCIVQMQTIVLRKDLKETVAAVLVVFTGPGEIRWQLQWSLRWRLDTSRDQGDELGIRCARWAVGKCSALGQRWNLAGQQKGLRLTQPFVAEEEERCVLENEGSGPLNAPPKLLRMN